MKRYELQKFPRLAVILTILGLLFAVVAMSISIMGGSAVNLGGLAIFEIVATVLVLAGLTTGKVILLRVINIIVTVGILVASFVLAIVKFTNHDVVLFAISILMLVASILTLIYCLTLKNERINRMYIYAGTFLFGLVLLYGIYYTAKDIYLVVNGYDYGNYGNYFLIFAMAVVSYLPIVNHRSLTEVDDEEDNEQPQEQEQEENKE